MMMTCPDCNGTGKRMVGSPTGSLTDYGQCPKCKGAGEVEQPEPQPETVPPPVKEPTKDDKPSKDKEEKDEKKPWASHASAAHTAR